MKTTTSFNALLAITVVSNIGVGLVMPILPVYLHRSGITISALGTPFAALVLGRLSSRLVCPAIIAKAGHRTTTVMMFAMYSAVLAAYLGSPDMLRFGMLRFLEGIVEGVLAVVLNDLAIACTRGYPSRLRVSAMGRFSAAFGLGFLAGPLLGSSVCWLANMEAVFVAAAAVALCGAVAAWLFIGPTAVTRERTSLRFAEAIRLAAAYSPQWFRRFAFLSLMILLPLHTTGVLQLSSESAGILFSASALLTTVVMPMAGAVSARLGVRLTVLYGLALIGAALLILGVATSPFLFVAIFFVETLCFAVAIPPAMSMFGALVEDMPARTAIVGTLSVFSELLSLPLTLLLPWLYARNAGAAWALVASGAFATCILFRTSAGRAPKSRLNAIERHQ